MDCDALTLDVIMNLVVYKDDNGVHYLSVSRQEPVEEWDYEGVMVAAEGGVIGYFEGLWGTLTPEPFPEQIDLGLPEPLAVIYSDPSGTALSGNVSSFSVDGTVYDEGGEYNPEGYPDNLTLFASLTDLFVAGESYEIKVKFVAEP